MTYETKPTDNPEASATFLKKELLGVVDVGDFGRVDGVCRAVEPPPKQFEGARRIEPGGRLRRCQEWTGEVVEMLRGEEVGGVEGGATTRGLSMCARWEGWGIVTVKGRSTR